MEWGLSVMGLIMIAINVSLNPCSNGMGIEQSIQILGAIMLNRLNPCSNGMGIEPERF